MEIRKNMGIDVKWEEEDNEESVAATWKKAAEKWLWGITYMRHKKEENYELMIKWIDKYRDRIIIINGDFNARTARGGGL